MSELITEVKELVIEENAMIELDSLESLLDAARTIKLKKPIEIESEAAAAAETPKVEAEPKTLAEQLEEQGYASLYARLAGYFDEIGENYCIRPETKLKFDRVLSATTAEELADITEDDIAELDRLCRTVLDHIESSHLAFLRDTRRLPSIVVETDDFI